MNSDSEIRFPPELGKVNIRWFDTHAHYWDKKIQDPYPLLDRLFESGLEHVVNVGTTADTSRQCLQMADRFPQMYVAAGIHPEDCHALEGRVEDEVEQIRNLIQSHRDKVVALGEIGLDYYWQTNYGKPLDKPLEKAYFDAQLSLAEELDLPVIIHDREAHGDCADILKAHPGVTGVLHSYSGSRETARELIKQGFYVSFSGVITFKNAARVAEVVREIPDDRILAETDCPYLAPVPYRGEINHSGMMILTLDAMARIRGSTLEKTAALTLENGRRLFRLKT